MYSTFYCTEGILVYLLESYLGLHLCVIQRGLKKEVNQNIYDQIKIEIFTDNLNTANDDSLTRVKINCLQGQS